MRAFTITRSRTSSEQDFPSLRRACTTPELQWEKPQSDDGWKPDSDTVYYVELVLLSLSSLVTENSFPTSH